MSMPIVDLHCDLLFYLQSGEKRDAFEERSRCSIPYLHKGGVAVQTFAVFTLTEPLSSKKGMAQIECYRHLLETASLDISAYSKEKINHTSQILALLAIENASGFCAEEEELAHGFARLQKIAASIAKPLYVSLTWNFENRFGGGALSKTGLKADGAALLELLAHLQIAVDLSHASDALACDIMDYIEKKNLALPILASHSNARSIAALPRNLNDELIQEIIRRKGVIGLNFCRKFVGENKESFLKQVAYFLELGAEDCLALGADFFYENDLPKQWQTAGSDFFPEFQNAACYPEFLLFLQSELRLPPRTLEKIAHANALSFINKLVLFNDFL